MVNSLCINASYNNQHHIFQCNQGDFLKQAAEKFKIDDIKSVELYAVINGEKRRIVQYDITDLMNIQIEDKRPRNGQQRTIDSYRQPKGVEKIITKLTDNSNLTGQERRDMVLLLQNYATITSNKRRIDDVTPEPKKSHKKVQVNMPFTNSKESTTQTDKIILPTSLQEGAIVEDQITDKMKKLSSKPDVNRQEIAKLMAESFDDRRVFIKMKSPPVSNLKEKYPFLFSLEEVKNELGRIFYSGKPQEFIDNMYKYAPLIVQKCKSDELKRRTEKSMNRCQTNVQKKYAEVVGSVFILTHLMNEQWRFIHLQDYPSGSDDIYPHIDASCQTLKELFFDGSLYDIKVEGLGLCDASNFLEAILCLVAAFFIFNIDYPQSCRQTMIMFEKLYLKANDTLELDEYTMQMVKLLELEGNNVTQKKKSKLMHIILYNLFLTYLDCNKVLKSSHHI